MNKTLGVARALRELATRVDRVRRGVGSEDDDARIDELVELYSAGDDPVACPDCAAVPAGANADCDECLEWRRG